jgi:hypothetical protein
LVFEAAFLPLLLAFDFAVAFLVLVFAFDDFDFAPAFDLLVVPGDLPAVFLSAI